MTKHPPVTVYVNRRQYDIACDCYACTRRMPMVGIGVILGVVALLVGLAGAIMRGC